jgi:sugar phosphate isomerase/epimerase
MDTGHLLLERQSPAAFFTQQQSRVREIHLHGIDPQKAVSNGRLRDHRPLTVRDLGSLDPWLSELLPHLRHFKGIVNLEVFSWEEVYESITLLREGGML